MKTLICTIYRGDADLVAIYKLSPDKIILLPQKLEGETEDVKKTVEKGIKDIKETFAKLKVTVETKTIDLYDIKKIIKETMQLIDQEHKQGNEVILHISEGRKTQSIAMLLAAYKRRDKVTACYYLVDERGGTPLALPLLDFSLSESKKGILEQVNKGENNVIKIAKNLKKSKALTYKLMKELKHDGFIKKDENELTESGKIAIL